MRAHASTAAQTTAAEASAPHAPAHHTASVDNRALERLAHAFAQEGATLDAVRLAAHGYAAEFIDGHAGLTVGLFRPTTLAIDDHGNLVNATVLAFHSDDGQRDVGTGASGVGQWIRNEGIIDKALRDASGSGGPTLIGHGAGGALASLTARLRPQYVGRVVTFNVPEVLAELTLTRGSDEDHRESTLNAARETAETMWKVRGYCAALERLQSLFPETGPRQEIALQYASQLRIRHQVWLSDLELAACGARDQVTQAHAGTRVPRQRLLALTVSRLQKRTPYKITRAEARRIEAAYRLMGY